MTWDPLPAGRVLRKERAPKPGEDGEDAAAPAPVAEGTGLDGLSVFRDVPTAVANHMASQFVEVRSGMASMFPTAAAAAGLVCRLRRTV